jgi:quercetin dioxygenase-like cupin family protein
MPILQNWNEIDAEAAGPSVRKIAIKGAGASLVRIEIAAGKRADRHSHPFEQFVHVVSGSGTLETQDGVQRFAAGSVFHFLPGTWHAAMFDEDTVLIETNLAEVAAA